ncbi:PREDICTED: zeatin O-glucosyltransferase-like [Ipomoea nil]|uniref:zeatin O-glucosyltransferase-like n=1 Tax=Ipomoea nil TaxID=35883 RepID=UPI000901E3B2|nr:PREDICTED: zeatin O-glucosyltransferase-like [Ipomoea nil]
MSPPLSDAQNVESSSSSSNVIVVMVPYLAQGHLNQLLHLSRLIASYDLPVYYTGFTVDISLARQRVHGWDPLAYPNLRFHSFPTPPSYLSGASSGHQSESFSDIVTSVVNGPKHLRGPIAELLDDLSPKCGRLVVVYDSLMATAVQEVAFIPNAEAYSFHAASAFTNATIAWEVVAKILRLPSFLSKLAGKFLLPAGAIIPDDLPSLESCFLPEFLKFLSVQRASAKFCSGNLYDTCRPMEGPYLDILAKLYRFTGKGKLWAIGPLNPLSTNPAKQRHRCLEWLDKQPPKSVVLVSFGTLTSLSDEQISELAKGLEQSQQKFIWVVRDVLKGENGRIGLPEGYQDRVEGRGLILRDWAPQLEILDHPSTGAFLTHCGWNSCMESISRGVPLATWPIHFDQPRNALLMTEVLKIGIAVKDWARRNEVIPSETVRKAVEKLMASPEGEKLRTRAAALGKDVKQSVMDGGGSRLEMANFITHITRQNYA